jgi:L-fuculose-phosphate aldolase
MLLERERDQLADIGRRLVADRLVVGAAGNLSIRTGDLIAITPSGIPYDTLDAAAMCIIGIDGDVVEAPTVASSEVPIHLAVYRGTKAGAVVHTHSPYATALSTVVDELPPIHYAIASLGGRVRVAPYHTFGTEALAGDMIRALEGRAAALLQNHGTVTHGLTIDEAYDRSMTLEWLSTLYWRAQLFGRPNILSDDEIDQVRQRASVMGYRAAQLPD